LVGDLWKVDANSWEASESVRFGVRNMFQTPLMMASELWGSVSVLDASRWRQNRGCPQAWRVVPVVLRSALALLRGVVVDLLVVVGWRQNVMWSRTSGRT